MPKQLTIQTHLPTKKRIAIVSNTSWSVFNFRLGLLKTLKQNGYEVLVIAPKDEFSERIIAEGVSYFELYLDNQGMNPLRDAFTLRQLTQLYKRLQIDFVFHYTIKPNIYGSWAARFNRIPCVAVTTGLGHLFLQDNWAAMVAQWLYRISLRYSLEVWFLNKEDIQTFVSKGIAPIQKTFLLPSEGINTRYFKRRRPAKPHQTFQFLFLGRIIWDKGIGEYVAAARQLSDEFPNVSFQVLGFLEVQNPNAVPTEQMNEWVQEGAIDYLGVSSDVRPYLENASCVVLPSSYREGISRVLLEAAAMEVPIITTDNVGCRDVVQHTVNGFLCEPKNTADLVAKMREMILLPDAQRLEMGRKSREIVITQFSEEVVLKHYLAFLSKRNI